VTDIRSRRETYTDLADYVHDAIEASAIHVPPEQKEEYKWTPLQIGKLYTAVMFSMKNAQLVSGLGGEATDQAIKRRQSACQRLVRYGFYLAVSYAETSTVRREAVDAALNDTLGELEHRVGEIASQYGRLSGSEGAIARALAAAKGDNARRDKAYHAIGEAVIEAANDYAAQKERRLGESDVLWNIALEYSRTQRTIESILKGI
jgi:hypothetical protein